MRQIESRDRGTKRDLRPVESRDVGTVPGLSGIFVPKCRDLLSRGILVAGLSRRFLSRSRLSRGFESRSRSRSWEFAGRNRNPDIVPGQPPIPVEYSLRIWVIYSNVKTLPLISIFHLQSNATTCITSDSGSMAYPGPNKEQVFSFSSQWNIRHALKLLQKAAQSE